MVNLGKAWHNENKEDYLLNLARDNTQLLFNTIWELPIERVDDVVLVKLPPPTTVIPREKPVPKAKPLTKWEQYAKTKGIVKKKKGRMVWDETVKDWRPRWGYKRANDDTKDWCIEVPAGADPNEDLFAKRKTEKKERIAKNELKRLRNIARSQKLKVSELNHTPTLKESRGEVNRKIAVAKLSTASVGKFTETLAKEKPAKNVGCKRKFTPNHSDIKAEAAHQLDLLGKLGKREVLNVAKAANMQMHEEEVSRAKMKKDNPLSLKKGKKNLGKSGKKFGKGDKFSKGDKKFSKPKKGFKSGRKGKVAKKAKR